MQVVPSCLGGAVRPGRPWVVRACSALTAPAVSLCVPVTPCRLLLPGIGPPHWRHAWTVLRPQQQPHAAAVPAGRPRHQQQQQQQLIQQQQAQQRQHCRGDSGQQQRRQRGRRCGWRRHQLWQLQPCLSAKRLLTGCRGRVVIAWWPGQSRGSAVDVQDCSSRARASAGTGPIVPLSNLACVVISLELWVVEAQTLHTLEQRLCWAAGSRHYLTVASFGG